MTGDANRSGPPGGGRNGGCREALERMPARYYGLLDEREVGEHDVHLDACAACASEWVGTKALFEAVDSAAAFPLESSVDWQRFARQTVDRARAADVRRPWLLPGRVWGGLLAAAAAIVLVVGWRITTVDGPGPAARPGGSPSPVSAEATRFLQDSLARQGAARYLRDSRSLLIDLMQAPVRCRRTDGTLDVVLEKERSEGLLRRSQLYLNRLEGPRDERLALLMQQLESVLLQVSALDDCSAAQALHDLRLAIERRQILMRIDLIAREVEEEGTRA